jgi:branched-chain amino acid transport system permease protein
MALPTVTQSSPRRLPHAGRRMAQAFCAAVILFLALSPSVLPDYYVFQLSAVLVYAIALLGVNLLTGYSGQISLGHGAFFALGAYLEAILIELLGIPYWAAVPVAGVSCLVAGYLFGWPALRLGGPYLALATFALALATPQILKAPGLEKLTGGVQGISLAKPDSPFGLPLSQDKWLYYFVMVWAALLFILTWNLVRSRLGLAIASIREHPLAAEAMGVNVARTKTVTFGISAMYAGISGALGALITQFVSPDNFTVFLSLSLVIGIVVGGVGTLSGALLGAAFITFVPNVADQISKAATWAVYGCLLLIVIFLLPNGLVGGLRKARSWLGH